MAKQDDGLMWMAAGGLGSMALAVLLIPLRPVTPASNLAFVLPAFTIVVAELGGRSAALVTALVSGMSLNFFLTEPYLTLTIEKRDDVIAFFALAVCGLIAARFGKRRAALSEVASRAGTELDVLKKLVDHLRAGAPLDGILGHLRTSFGLGALVLRDSDDRILGAAPVGASPASIPETRPTPETLFPSDESRLRFGARGLRLPFLPADRRHAADPRARAWLIRPRMAEIRKSARTRRRWSPPGPAPCCVPARPRYLLTEPGVGYRLAAE